MLFNEPKLLKSERNAPNTPTNDRFSALQRAEIAEIARRADKIRAIHGFSALQRAEIAEIRFLRAAPPRRAGSFSALQRAEIAEIERALRHQSAQSGFQCSSTSRNC